MKRFIKSCLLPMFWPGLLVVCLLSISAWLSVACLAHESAVPTPPFNSNPAAHSSEIIPARANPQLKFDHLGLEHGLSQSSIYGIAQDQQGFLWFGTEDGLNGYDGYDFVVYKPDPDEPNSLADGFIQTLYTDRDGLLWIGTNSGGLDRFNPRTVQFTHFTHNPADANSLSSNDILSIFQGDSAIYWIGTHGSGLNQLEIIPAQNEEPEQVKINHFRHDDADPAGLSHNVVTAIYQDQAAVLWVGTQGGLDQFDPITGSFTHYRHDPDDPHSLSDNQVTAVFQDGAGTLWVGTEMGLNRLLSDSGNGRFTRYLYDSTNPSSISQNQIRVIYEDRAGQLWVGTEGGLNLFQPATNTFSRIQHDPADPLSLANDSVLSIFEDKSGVFWVGFPGGGLSLAEPGQGRFALYRSVASDPTSLSHEVVFGMDEAPDQTIWIGTQGGLNHFNPATDTFISYQHDPQNKQSLVNDIVWAVAVANTGDVWAGTERGLDRFDPDKGLFTHYQHDPDVPNSLSHNQIWTLYQDHAGDLWVGTEAGLSLYLPESGSFQNFQHDPNDPTSLSGQAVVGIFEDRQGNLWVGTFDGGLNRLDRTTGTFTAYQHDPEDPTSLSHNAVMSFYEDEDGRLWLGTYGGGLNIFDPQTEQFQHIREEDGLPSDVVYAILEDNQGLFWLSTNQGLSRFDPQSETFQNFNINDGLQSNEFDLNAYLQSSSGEFYFGGINGLNRFNPNEIHLNTYLPPVALTTLTQNGQTLMPELVAPDTAELSLTWPNNGVEFEMSALSYDRPEKNQYAFLLAGFDDDWNMVGTHRFGRYTNLPGGDYVLYLAAANADGVWHISEQPVHITVMPPWWSSWTFRGLIILAVLGAISGGYWWRLRNIQTHSQELATQVAERTTEVSALYTITAVVSSTLDLHETLTAALNTTLELTACDAGGLHLIQGQTAALQFVKGCCLSDVTLCSLMQLATTDSFVEAAVKTGEPYILTDLYSLTAIPFQSDGFNWLAVIPLTARGVVLGSLFIARQDMESFSAPGNDLLTSIGNQIGVAIENARLFAAEQRRAEQFQLIAEVSNRFSSILNIDEVLAEVTRLIQQTYGYYHVALGLIEGDYVVYRQGAGSLWEDPEFDFQPGRLKVEQEGLTGWVAGSGQPLIVPDVTQESRYILMKGSATRSEMTVPLIIKDQVIGVLDVQSDQLDDFDEPDLMVMQLLAGQAAIAVENARLYEQAQQLAVMEERARLARDLHDSVTQSIYSLTLLAEAGQRMIQAGDTAVIQQNQERLGAIAQQALQEMRLLVFELRPLDLRQTGLVEAIEHRLEVVERRAGVDVKLTVSDDLLLPEEVEDALYRIAQESLNNALKHAQATAVSVNIQAAAGNIKLEVQDNGRGFETALAERLGGLGLVSMRERVQKLHGQFAIHSAPGQGATVCVQIPVKPHKETAVNKEMIS